MIRQRNQKAYEKLTFKRTEVNLNYLRNDIDIWNRLVTSWIDTCTRKSTPSKDVIKKLGIEVIQKLCIRKVLKKKDIDEMKFPELPSTPRRSRSASPNRPTTPDSSPRTRSKSIRRVSPKDRHVHFSDCQKKLDFKDDEDGYKVEADTENYYKCRISLLEKQIIKLEKELQRTATNKDFELLANVYVNKFRDFKNIVDGKHIDGCPKCTLKDGFIQRYIAERNLLKEDNQRLEKMLDVRNSNELLKEQKDNRLLVKDNESLKEILFEIENNHAEEKKQQIDIEHKLKLQVNNLKIQNSEADKKVTYARKELEEMSAKYKEQQSLFESKKIQYEKKINESRIQLDDMRKSTEYRCYSKVEGRSDTEKENISLKSELTEALKNIAKIRQDYDGLSKKLEINNYENSSIIKENKELKNILQEKLSVVKRLETRCKNLQTVEKNVQKLKKEKQQLETLTEMISQRQTIVSLNSRVKIVNDGKLELEERLRLQELDVLRLKLHKMDFENSILNKRLQIDNIEKSSVLKENKELKSVKNLLQEKLSEVKRLEIRVQQYAEKFEDIPVLERHMDKLQKDNDELNQKCTHLQKAVKDVQKLNRENIQLETDNISQRQDNETLNSRLEMLNVEKLEIEDRLRLQDDEVELLFKSLETERQEHESAMKKLEMLYVAVQNECVELLLKLQKIHNSSEISFENLNSVIDKDIFGQKLEETTAQENTMAKETTKILENFASAKDKKGCIEVLKKRFEKALPKCDNGISSAEKTDMKDNISNSSCTKYYEETVMESQATCHNRIHRTTNVTNFNIAGSNVSFNESTQQLSRLNGNNGQYPAIEERN